MFVRAVLGRWKLSDHIETAELAMSELATNAVKTTGFTETEPKSWEITAQHVIGVQLRALGTSLFLEVWDGSTNVPVTKNPDADAQGGRGMRIISMLAKQWDVYRPSVGGKVVGAELDLTQPAEPPSPYSAPPWRSLFCGAPTHPAATPRRPPIWP
jgi:anti-sigma regulatory factor (Ser/Thr protein kinase)